MVKEKNKKKKKSFADIFSKYKTYDASEGFGDTEDWKNSFKKRMGDEKKEPEIKYFNGCDTSKKLTVRYRELMKQYHPDRVGNTEENNRISTEVIEEYNRVLKNIK